jgi:hypothetical protein
MSDNEITVGVVVPVMRNFEGAVKALHSIDHTYTWTPFIGHQWELDFSLARSWNTCIEDVFFEGYDYALVINDDVLFRFDTLVDLVDAWKTAPKDTLMLTGSNVRGLCEPYELTEPPFPLPQREYDPSPDFSCFMVRPDFFEIVGHFDEDYYPAYFEDNDMHYRMKLAGCEAYRVTSAIYYHYGSVTHHTMVAEQGAARHEQFRYNQGRYLDKWGGLPGSERFIYPWNNHNGEK